MSSAWNSYLFALDLHFYWSGGTFISILCLNPLWCKQFRMLEWLKKQFFNVHFTEHLRSLCINNILKWNSRIYFLIFTAQLHLTRVWSDKVITWSTQISSGSSNPIYRNRFVCTRLTFLLKWWYLHLRPLVKSCVMQNSLECCCGWGSKRLRSLSINNVLKVNQ